MINTVATLKFTEIQGPVENEWIETEMAEVKNGNATRKTKQSDSGSETNLGERYVHLFVGWLEVWSYVEGIKRQGIEI
jgi:hypothetical protein